MVARCFYLLFWLYNQKIKSEGVSHSLLIFRKRLSNTIFQELMTMKLIRYDLH